MTNEEAIHQLEFLKKVYSYKSMIEALDLAIKVLEQQQDVHDTCKKCIEFSEFKQPSEIHCEFSDENVAKAFIEDVEAVKDKLPKSSEDCRNCKKWNKCPCGKEGHENGTSIGYSIGECKDYEPCEDCISREAVLLLQTEYVEKMGETTFWKLRDDIRGLPSVTPSNADTREAYLKGYDYGVKDWFMAKTQPCEDAVSRDDVDAYIAKLMSGYLYDEERTRLEEFSAYLWELPPVTPERPNPDVVEKMKKVIDEMTEIHSDGEFYIKNVDAKWIINKYLYGAEMSGGGENV